MHKYVPIYPCLVKYIYIVFNYLFRNGRFGKVFAIKEIGTTRDGES